MEAYTNFATVYDVFMDETPYEEWKNCIVRILQENGIEDGLLLDLGCGTGTMTMLLAEAGYDMIGVDMSVDMLDIAKNKSQSVQPEILYLCQDMREFELYGTVRGVICVCDSINYLLEEEEIIQTISLVNNYLDPRGIFIFDFNTVYKYREVIGDRVIAENRDTCSFIWDNYYDAENGINEYELAIFVKDAASSAGNHYLKFEEEHYQKGYELEEMKACLEKAGLVFVNAYDTDTGAAVHAKTERITVIARENGK